MAYLLVDDPAGVLPAGAEKLMAACIETVCAEKAAKLVGMTLEEARALLAHPKVEPINKGVWDATLAYVAAHGRSVISFDDDNDDAAAESPPPDSPVNIRESRV